MTKKELDKFIELTKKYFGEIEYQEYPGSPVLPLVTEDELEGYEEYIRNEFKSK